MRTRLSFQTAVPMVSAVRITSICAMLVIIVEVAYYCQVDYAGENMTGLPSKLVFDLTAGCLCLDFANTVDKRLSSQPEDKLAGYKEFVALGNRPECFQPARGGNCVGNEQERGAQNFPAGFGVARVGLPDFHGCGGAAGGLRCRCGCAQCSAARIECRFADRARPR